MESFEQSKSVLEVVPKLKLADCIFCDLGAIVSAEMLLQLDLALALKKEFCCVVAKTNIQRIPRKAELKSHHIIIMETSLTGKWFYENTLSKYNSAWSGSKPSLGESGMLLFGK